MDIMNSVYSTLKDATGVVAEMQSEIDKLQADNDSGRFSDTVKRQNVERINELKRQIENKSFETLGDVKRKVAAACDELARLDDLDGAQLTDDAKLFSCGVPLTERDLVTILRRNSDNATMKQLAVRYAQEHGLNLRDYCTKAGIPTATVIYVNHSREIQAISGLVDTAERYLNRWVADKQGPIVLARFFNMTA